MRLARALSVVAIAFAAAAVPSGPTATSDPSIEADVFAKINAARSSSFVQHAGLLSVARQHSAYMSRRGAMSHDNADARISNAPPDPIETNGAPDDGWPPASWCENVTYVMYVTSDKVAGRIYSQWDGSGAHGRCMKDTKRNVGAVGVHYDGEAWWATFIAAVDNTPPGGAAPRASSAPKREEPAPRASEQPAPTERNDQPAPAGSTDVSDDAQQPRSDSDTGAADDEDSEPPVDAEPEPTDDLRPLTVERDEIAGAPIISVDTITEPILGSTSLMRSGGYGWQDLAAVVALLTLATVLLKRVARGPRRARRRKKTEAPPATPRAEPVPEPVAAPRERELVGSSL